MANITHVNILLEILLKTYFYDSRCVFMFTEPIKKIEVHLEIPVVYHVIHNNTLNSNSIFRHYGCQDIVINHENASDIFVQFEKLINLNNERFNARRYIIMGEDAMRLFQTKELDYIADLVVVDDSDISYNLVTHFFRYNSTISETIDVWFPQNCSFLYKTNLFPDKLRNQNGRQLRVGTFTYEPYSIVEDDGTAFHGTETSLVLEFVKKYNLTASFTIIGDDLWGDIYENWTGIGLLGSLVDDSVDVGYAAVYTWEEYYKYLDYTKPLTRTGISCLVPAPRLAAGWLTPLFSFSMEMWIGLLVVLMSDSIILSLLFYKNRRKHSVQDSVITILKMYLVQSLTIKMEGKIMKYFIALNMLNVLFISSAYSSGLSTVMTVPRYDKAIKTVKDLALSGLPWGAPTDAWLISLRHVDDDDYVTIKRQFVVKTEEDLVSSSKVHNFGFSLERLPYGHYAVGSYVRHDVISDYRVMQEDIYWEQCIFLLRKNSVLLPLMDDLILRVFEAGLAAYWENEVVFQYMDMSVQRGISYYIHNVKEHATVKLRWTHVEGAFGILLIGYATSAVAFVMEVLTRSQIRLNQK